MAEGDSMQALLGQLNAVQGVVGSLVCDAEGGLLAQAFPQASKSTLGWLAAIPPLVTVPVMILHGRSSDARQEQRWHVAFAVFAQATGLLLLSLGLPAPAPNIAVNWLARCVRIGRMLGPSSESSPAPSSSSPSPSSPSNSAPPSGPSPSEMSR